MTIKKTLLALSVLLVALAALTVASAQERPSTRDGIGFRGTWWMSTGPPAARPLVLTLTKSGTFMLEDSIDGGGHTFSGASFSMTQGSWVRDSERTAMAMGLRFVYDASGKTMSVERVRLTLRLVGDSDELEGTYTYEQMDCTEESTPLPFTVPNCPDPSVAPTEVLRGPAPFTAVRVGVDAPIG